MLALCVFGLPFSLFAQEGEGLMEPEEKGTMALSSSILDTPPKQPSTAQSTQDPPNLFEAASDIIQEQAMEEGRELSRNLDVSDNVLAPGSVADKGGMDVSVSPDVGGLAERKPQLQGGSLKIKGRF